jgi:hypothetical protein
MSMDWSALVGVMVGGGLTWLIGLQRDKAAERREIRARRDFARGAILEHVRGVYLDYSAATHRLHQMLLTNPRTVGDEAVTAHGREMGRLNLVAAPEVRQSAVAFNKAFNEFRDAYEAAFKGVEKGDPSELGDALTAAFARVLDVMRHHLDELEKPASS